MRLGVVSVGKYPIPPVRGGAVETKIYEVCRRLRGFEVVVCCRAGGLPPFEREGTLGIRRWRGGPLGFLLRRWRAYHLWSIGTLRRFRPHVVHLHGDPQAIAWYRRLLPTARIVFHPHNLLEQQPPEVRRAWHRAGSYDAFIAVSEFLLRREANRMARGARRRVVIRNGVDTERFRPGRGGDGRTILFVGILKEKKGFPYVLRAVEELRRRMPEVRLLVAGKAPRGLRLPAWVSYLGFVPPMRMQEVYAQADVLVAPSVWEDPCPNVVLEAQAAGLPVVTTPRGGIPELLVPGETGFLVEPEGLVDPLERLLRDRPLRERMGERARRWAVSERSLDRMVKELEELYRGL